MLGLCFMYVCYHSRYNEGKRRMRTCQGDQESNEADKGDETTWPSTHGKYGCPAHVGQFRPRF